MSEFGVEELDWPAQSPDLNPIEHLWDELERRLRARPSRLTSVSDLTNALLEEWSKIPINTLLNLWKAFPEELKLLRLQRVGRHHIKPYGLRMGCNSSSYACEGRCPNTFGNIVYLIKPSHSEKTDGSQSE